MLKFWKFSWSFAENAHDYYSGNITDGNLTLNGPLFNIWQNAPAAAVAQHAIPVF